MLRLLDDAVFRIAFPPDVWRAPCIWPRGAPNATRSSFATGCYGLGTSSPCRIDHADTGETSVALELIPNLVRMDRQIGPDILSGERPFAQRGMPSAEGGRQLWEAYCADATALIEAAYAKATAQR